jgi:hypothetical protein
VGGKKMAVEDSTQGEMPARRSAASGVAVTREAPSAGPRAE